MCWREMGNRDPKCLNILLFLIFPRYNTSLEQREKADSLQSTGALHCFEFALAGDFRRGHEISVVEPEIEGLMRHYFGPFEFSISFSLEWGSILCRDSAVYKLYSDWC